MSRLVWGREVSIFTGLIFGFGVGLLVREMFSFFFWGDVLSRERWFGIFVVYVVFFFFWEK